MYESIGYVHKYWNAFLKQNSLHNKLINAIKHFGLIDNTVWDFTKDKHRQFNVLLSAVHAEGLRD